MEKTEDLEPEFEKDMKTEDLQTIAAVIVTFYPDAGLDARLNAVFSQVGKIVIVDNNSTVPVTQDLLSTWERKGCHIIRNSGNIGAAAALNQGISWAAKNGYQWILTLDQDTSIDPRLLDLYTNAIEKDFAGVKVGVLNTVYRDANTGKLAVNPGIKKGWSDVAAVITSGSFFSVDTFRKVGPFREDFFLDWADHDFCLRARASGMRNYLYNEPLIEHTVGSKTEHAFEIPTNNHSPFRCYLVSRNLVILLKKNYFREFRWAAFLTFYLMSKFILVVCFEKNKLDKLRHLTKGFFDGLFNRSSAAMIKQYQIHQPK